MIFLLLILNSFLTSFEIVDVSNNVSTCEKMNIIIFITADAENLDYQWFKDGIALQNETNNAILFNNITFDKSGMYFCEVTDQLNNVTKLSREIILNAKPKTNITNKVNNIYVFEGQTLRLKCDLSDISENDIDAKWYNNKWELINNNDKFSGAKSNLLGINELLFSDSLYYCVIEGDCGKDTAIFHLDYYKIKLSQKTSKTVCQGYDVNVTFSISELNKKVLPSNFNVNVYNSNGEKINFISEYLAYYIKVNLDEKMTSKLIRKLHCDINFSNKVLTSEIAELSIYNNTKLSIKTIDFLNLKEGNDLTLLFSATGNIQKYIWYKDNVLMDTTNNGLYFKKQVTKEDSGVYTCLVKNFCKDTTFFISEVLVEENAYPLSVELLNNNQNIELIVDAYGRIINHRDYALLRNGLYFIKFNDNNYKKYFKYD